MPTWTRDGAPAGGLPGFSGTVLGLFLVQIAVIIRSASWSRWAAAAPCAIPPR